MNYSAPRHLWRHLWITGCIFILLTAAGCWMPGSSGSIQTPVAQDLPTLTPVPSETPIPTFTNSPEPTIEELVESPTPSPSEELLVTEELLATEEVDLGITEIAQLPTDPDPLVQGATDFVATITQEVIDQTQTAEAEFFVATETPTPEFQIETETPTPQPIVSGADCVH
ncbi:MAG TPA: hypothetical protein VHL11_19730, partial [Phototrophicaceae bacterium]|nr:hypothetical protein [Phototrophicaceae bacterium]